MTKQRLNNQKKTLSLGISTIEFIEAKAKYLGVSEGAYITFLVNEDRRKDEMTGYDLQ